MRAVRYVVGQGNGCGLLASSRKMVNRWTINRWMDGWMYGWMYEWMDGWMDGWMDVQNV